MRHNKRDGEAEREWERVEEKVEEKVEGQHKRFQESRFELRRQGGKRERFNNEGIHIVDYWLQMNIADYQWNPLEKI